MSDFAYIHKVCGKVAFYLDHMPEFGERVSSEGVTDKDGNPVKEGSRVLCSSCMEPIQGLGVDRIVPRESVK